ncbi:MAG: hypothetical protein FWE41_05140 [Coriobacteriia bacterium]|nr:hypothetical protein [Coriobacteriia bacterium]MCL2749657.1 hypothetical protein [Coriobacteriia bacterium]
MFQFDHGQIGTLTPSSCSNLGHQPRPSVPLQPRHWFVTILPAFSLLFVVLSFRPLKAVLRCRQGQRRITTAVN